MAKSAVKKPAPRPKAKKPVKAAAKPKAPKVEYATKEEILQLVPKKALSKYVTKEELAGLMPGEAAAGGAGKDEWVQLDRRIDMIEKRIDSTERKIDALADQIENNTANVDRMHVEVEELRRESVGYQSREDADRELQSLRDEVADLTDRVNGLKEDWSEGGPAAGM
jgi:chromosome segregation ATPase